MEKPVVGEIDAHVPGISGGLKKDQVSRLQGVPADRGADFDLSSRGARQIHLKHVSVDRPDEPGAIDALAARSTHPVPGTAPVRIDVAQGRLDV
jgi:hypothetical protein